MVTGWLDRGIDGFRLDVFNAFLKAADMPSNPEVAAGGSIPWDRQEHRHDKDQPELHDLLSEFRGIAESRSRDRHGRRAVHERHRGRGRVLGTAPSGVRLGPHRDTVVGGRLSDVHRRPGGRLVRSLAGDRAVQP